MADRKPWRLAENTHRFVILGRSKERSDAAQTPGSMPRLQSAATVQNSAPRRPSAKITAWIPGSPRRSSAPASPRDDEVGEASANPERWRWPARQRLSRSLMSRN
ncbi:MAG: hypothetical protein E5Y88_11475 [Mesorhizobium sp.]|nr:hypothetical protein EOC93_30710 [Mesorhizobium sp. M6A.T.Ce.TU.002.03.1.1]RWP45606.1 MAG: hypothetical protein EOR05_23805 [Mesorhizobium sp.]TIL25574.1 MAG: hypothetical protein E5Y88_11475 [Mesorhizobium sp.]